MCACCHFSHVQLFATLWTVAHQAPVHGFLQAEFCSGLPCPPPGDLPQPGIKPASLESPALAGGFFAISSASEAPGRYCLGGLFELRSCSVTIGRGLAIISFQR